jgi:site-specific recombinase XerC
MATEQLKLLDRVRAEIRARHYRRRTEEAYVHWIRRYILYHGTRHSSELGSSEITSCSQRSGVAVSPARIGDSAGCDGCGSEGGALEASVIHTFRDSFARHLLEAGYDIRTVQERWATRMSRRR